MPGVRWKRAYSTEDEEAAALWQWKETHKHVGEAIRKLVHIPNESPFPRHLLKEAAFEQNPELKNKLWSFINGTLTKLKTWGVTPGVSDYFTPVARGKYHGLFLELKTQRGTISKSQKRWQRWVEDEGYAFVLAYGWEKAAQALEAYEGLGEFDGGKKADSA